MNKGNYFYTPEPSLPSFVKESREYILFNHLYFISLLTDIHSAKKTIDLCTYIFNDDTLGQQVAQELCEAAKRGVNVRVLVDGIGSFFWGGKIREMMETSGVKTRIYHPLPWMIWHWGSAAHVPHTFINKIIFLLAKINSRNHRKFCIIDDDIVYVSSANITKAHLPKAQGGEAWRDTTVRLSHIETLSIRNAFEKSWKIFARIKKIKSSQANHNGDQLFNINLTWNQRRKFYKQLLKKISLCQTRVWITSAYFIPDLFLLKALKRAALKGVDVKILLPQKSDVMISSLAALAFYTELLKYGIKIYEYMPAMLHAKTFILDDFYQVGSSNLNTRSFKHDLEIDVNIQSLEAKNILYQQFLIDLENSNQITLANLQKQSVVKKILGRIALLLRSWL